MGKKNHSLENEININNLKDRNHNDDKPEANKTMKKQIPTTEEENLNPSEQQEEKTNMKENPSSALHQDTPIKIKRNRKQRDEFFGETQEAEEPNTLFRDLKHERMKQMGITNRFLKNTNDAIEKTTEIIQRLDEKQTETLKHQAELEEKLEEMNIYAQVSRHMQREILSTLEQLTTELKQTKEQINEW